MIENEYNVFTTPREYKFNLENTEFSIMANAIYPRDKHVKLYSHSFYVMIFVSRGNVKVTVENDDVSLGIGEVMIVAPNINHMTFFQSEDTEASCVSFSFFKNTLECPNDIYSKLDKILPKKYRHIKDNNSIFDVLQKCFSSITSANKYIVSAAFHEVIIALMAESGILKFEESVDEIFPDSDISRVHKINTLANVYYDRNISVEDIAKMLFLSTRQANRIIQNHFGCAWRELIIQKRMLVAVDLIQNTEMTIEEISEYVGYESVRGFYSSFKKYYKKPPSAYR